MGMFYFCGELHLEADITCLEFFVVFFVVTCPLDCDISCKGSSRTVFGIFVAHCVCVFLLLFLVLLKFDHQA